MKKQTLNLSNLLNEIINEVGDLTNISSWDYELNNNGGIFKFIYNQQEYKCVVEFTDVPNNLNVSFSLPPIINHLNKKIVSVGFSVEGTDEQHIKTDQNTLLKILKTVTFIIRDCIKKYPDNTIFVIFATSKIGRGFNDSQKMRLYKLILQHNLPTNYRMGDGNLNQSDLIFLTKK
jgi:hypothetical protein